MQLHLQEETSNGEVGVQPAFLAGAEEAAEGLPYVNEGFSGPADQKTPGVYPHLQLPVWFTKPQIRWAFGKMYDKDDT